MERELTRKHETVQGEISIIMTTATESYSNIEKARDVILYVGIALLIITSFYIVVTDANCLIPPNDKILYVVLRIS